MLAAALTSLMLAGTPAPQLRRAVLPGGVVRLTQPRTDIDLYVGGIKIAPEMELTACAAIQRTEKGALLIGELPLTEEQAAKVERAALELGLEVTGLDDHFSGESPRMVFLHFAGTGEEAGLESSVRNLFAAAFATEGSAPALAQLETTHAPLTTQKLAAILGAGQTDDGVFRVERPRVIHLRGQAISPQLGAASWAAFTGADDSAAVTGAFAVEDASLQPLLKLARAQNLTVTSIDAPWVGAQPSVRWVHFWATGPAAKLAHAVQASFTAAK